MTALWYVMREPRSWEPPENSLRLTDALNDYFTNEEKEYVLSKNNKQAAILFLQSKHIRKLKEPEHIWEFAFLELEALLETLFALQGKSERIKNFPYPRQYATLEHNFTFIILLLLPFGIVSAFAEMRLQLADSFPQVSEYFIWAAIPICGIVSLVFQTMDRIGRTDKNPFEGTANDVPISTIS